MKEKISTAIKNKIQGIDDAILICFAEKKADGVTDESQTSTIIEGVSLQEMLTSYGDFRTRDATLSVVSF